MKKTDKVKLNDELREEYDLTKLKAAIRGKYAERFKKTTIVRKSDAHEVNTDSKTEDTDTK